jgi:DNA mismatch endonuclease (patch repair protein)
MNLHVTSNYRTATGRLSFFFFMADVHDKKMRSYNMSRIKGKNTKPEMLVRTFLHVEGSSREAR